MSIGDPFQLYLSSTLAQKKELLEAVAATHNPDCPGYATVTAQGEGIHIWDLQNLHAVSSYSVQNKVAFAIPAFSLYVSENGSKLAITYALIANAPGLAERFCGHTIWVIRHNISGATLMPSEMTERRVDIPPTQICGSGHDTLPLLFVSDNGSLFLLNAQVDVKDRLDWPGDRKHIKTFVFPVKSCNFIHGETDSYSRVVVTCCMTDTILHVRVALIGEQLVLAGVCSIPLASTTIVVYGITCSHSGVLSVIDSQGIWSTYQFICLDSTLISNPISDHLHLQRLAVLKAKSPARKCISIVSLNTSLVLLASVADLEGTKEIFLQIWDLTYGVILALRSMPIPSAIPDPDLNLTLANEGHVLLTISPSSHHEKRIAPKRSTIHIVPVDPRLKSSITAALGKAALTAEWLKPDASGSLKPRVDDASAKIIVEIQKCLKVGKNAQNAEQIFLKWLDSCSSKETVLGHEFVKEVLNIVLPSEPPTDYPYPPRIIRCILENAVVSTIMLNGRLITMLRHRGDWDNLMFALTTVADVSEDELMASAKFLVDRQRRIENTMDVDASESYAPPLWSYLSACVSYSFSAAPMRLAIRKYLPDARDLVMVLEILENWIQGGTEHEVEALLKSTAADTKMTSSGADSPPYPKIVMFLHALLDASFVALLQYQPSHDLLRRVLSYIEPEIRLMDSLEPLHGMLEPFAKAQMLRVKEKTGMSTESPAEWRKRKKRLEEQASLTVGLYRLEELSI